MNRQDQIIALIRTGVPTLVGALLAFLIAHVPFVAAIVQSVDTELAGAGFVGVSALRLLQAVIVALIVMLYYVLARYIGSRWPVAEKWLLGHSATPTYAVQSLESPSNVTELPATVNDYQSGNA